MYLIDEHLYLIIVLVWLAGTMLVSFSLIRIVSQSFVVWVSPELGPFVCAQSVQTSNLKRDEQSNGSAVYATAVLHQGIKTNTIYDSTHANGSEDVVIAIRITWAKQSNDSPITAHGTRWGSDDQSAHVVPPPNGAAPPSTWGRNERPSNPKMKRLHVHSQ